MKAVVVYKDQSDHARAVIDWMRDFYRQSGKQIESLEPESREGIDFCRLYDIVEYPTIVALDNEDKPLQVWRGQPLPLINEVSYYVD